RNAWPRMDYRVAARRSASDGVRRWPAMMGTRPNYHALIEYKRCAERDLRSDNRFARVRTSRDPARLECRVQCGPVANAKSQCREPRATGDVGRLRPELTVKAGRIHHADVATRRRGGDAAR